MKTTKLQYEQFKQAFMEMVERFGLKEFQIYFEHTELKAEAFAQILPEPDSGCATVRYNKIIHSENKQHIDPVKSGQHEAVHLLISTLGYYARCRYIAPDNIIEAEEKLVNRILGIL